MSAAQALDPARLEELHRRFDRAACDHPSVDAVVVYRPDLRSEEAERQARDLHVKPADPASENYAAEFSEQTRGTHAAIRCAMAWDAWIPPSDRSIEQLGGQMYWARLIRADDCPECCGLPSSAEIWRCTLFGPPACEAENTALRLFNMLAADAARLILPSSEAKGKGLLSRWLIHLADRPDPIVPDSRRRYLYWPLCGGRSMSPMWVPVTPQNGPTTWWAVRLPNVFQLSRDAIEQAIDLTAQTPAAAVLQDADKTILVVLAEAGRALLNSEIVRVAAKLVREKGGTTARAEGLVSLSETKVGERVPILEVQGLVSRPLGPDGTPTRRKGVGITDMGRARLANMS